MSDQENGFKVFKGEGKGGKHQKPKLSIVGQTNDTNDQTASWEQSPQKVLGQHLRRGLERALYSPSLHFTGLCEVNPCNNNYNCSQCPLLLEQVKDEITSFERRLEGIVNIDPKLITEERSFAKPQHTITYIGTNAIFMVLSPDQTEKGENDTYIQISSTRLR